LQSFTSLATPSSNKSPATNGDLDPGLSVRFGPVRDKDVAMKDADAPALSKRKSRASIDNKKSYAEPESSEDDQPLVRYTLARNSIYLRL
jgi:DNA topoisomerase-1